jgi:hypothetical protein
VRLVVVAIALAVITAASAHVAFAHQSSTKYVAVQVDGARVHLTLRCAPGDVTEPMHLGADARPPASEAAAAPGVPTYVARWVAINSGCSTTDATARAEPDGFIAVTWTATCPRASTTLALDFTTLFALDRRMEVLVTVGEADAALRVTARAPVLTVELGAKSMIGAGLRAMVAPERLAIMLLSVLVAFAFARTPVRTATLANVGYSVACAVGSASTLAIVPAVGTIAVAATVVYAALEVAARPDPRWRALTFVVFGVVHGIARPFNAFAAVSTTMLAGGLALALARLVRPRRVVPVVAMVVAVGGLLWCACAINSWTS